MPSQPSSAQLQQENDRLQAELAQSRSHLAVLQQENDRLGQSEWRYRQIFENAPISMLLINTAGYITEMNAAAEDLYGLAIEMLNQQACPIFTNSQLVENGTLPYMLRAMAGEAVVEPPTCYDASKDYAAGKFNYGRGHYAPVRNAMGEVEEIVEITADYNEVFFVQGQLLQEQERAAQERAQLLSTIAQVANLLLSSSDYTTAFPVILELLGKAVRSDRCAITKDVIHPSSGRPAVKILVEWCSAGIADSRPTAPELQQALEWENLPEFREKFLQGESANFLISELSAPSRQVLGGQGVTSILVVPIMIAGQPWGQIGFDNCGEPRLYDQAEIAILQIAADSIAAAITRQAKEDELRRSEVLYRSLFEISNEGIYRFEFDPPIPLALSLDDRLERWFRDNRITMANRTFAEQYGLDSPEQFIGSRVNDFYIDNSEVNIETNIQLISGDFRCFNQETEEVDASGNQRYFLSNVVTSIQDDDIIGGWGTQIDITELRKTQQALLQAEQARVAELAKTNQALKNSIDRLAADPDLNSFLGYVLLEISHQLNLDVATLRLYDPATQTLPIELEIEQGEIKLKHQLEAPEVYLRPSITSTPVWEILLRTRQPFVVDRSNGQAYCFNGTYEHQADAMNLQVAINLLLTLGDEPIGLLGLGSTQRSAIPPQELELAQALAHQATLAIQLTRLAEEAKHASILQERNRIAQDIHDTLAQAFGGILIQLQATQYFLKRNPDQAIEQFNVAIDLARQGLAEARRSVWTLYDRGADYQAVETALPLLAERLTAGSGTEATVTVTGTPYRLDPDIGQNLLRLAQEAINNALRHAHAQTIKLVLHYEPDRLTLQIQDDGCGFDTSQPVQGFGITGMKQRADYLGSTLSLTSQLGSGTEVAIVVATTALVETPPSNLTDYLPAEGASKPPIS